MKTIYVGYTGKHVVMEQPDIDIKVPVIFKYYKTMDSFSLLIDPKPDAFEKMLRNIKKHGDSFEYAMAHFVCPTKQFSEPECWEVEGLDSMPKHMRERLLHYWEGFTGYWFKTFCSENTRMWTGNTTDLSTRCYLSDAVIPEASNCTFILGGEQNAIRFSKLSNVLIHILDDCGYYEVT